MNIWMEELGDLYMEGWNPGSPNLAGNVRGLPRAQETATSLRMKGVFGSGDSPANMASLSQASGQNPTEQEEEVDNYKQNFIEDAIGHIKKIKHLNDMNLSHKTIQSAVNYWKELNDNYGYLSEEEFQELVKHALHDNTNNENYLNNNHKEVVNEGKSGHGDEAAVRDLIKHAIRKGLIKPNPREISSGGWILYSAKDNSTHTTHKGEKGLHPLRRYLEKLQEI